jgi:type I restriction enzyme, R subunit
MRHPSFTVNKEVKINDYCTRRGVSREMRYQHIKESEIVRKRYHAVLPRNEANSFIDDFKFLSQKRQMLRNFYGGVALSLREDGKKVQQLIDDHIRSLQIAKIMDVREITDSTFLSDAFKITKSEKARTALVKNNARQLITEKAHLNPAYYEKMKERLENLINEEKEERKEDADYFNSYKKILEELSEQEKERAKLELSNAFEHAIFEELKITKDKELSKLVTKKYQRI